MARETGRSLAQVLTDTRPEEFAAWEQHFGRHPSAAHYAKRTAQLTAAMLAAYVSSKRDPKKHPNPTSPADLAPDLFGAEAERRREPGIKPSDPTSAGHFLRALASQVENNPVAHLMDGEGPPDGGQRDAGPS